MANQQQLDIETQINAAIKQRQAMLEQQKSVMAQQIALAQELCRAMECEELDGYNERIAETQQGLLKAADAADEARESTNKMGPALKKQSKGFKMFSGVALGAFIGIKNALGSVLSILGSVADFVKNVLVGAFNVLKMAYAAWNSMIGGMLKKGQELANNGIGLRNAYEAVRESFGDLASGEGRDVINTFESMRGYGRTLAGTGLRLSRIFGRGPDGLAAQLDYLREKAEEMGAGFTRFSDDFLEAGENIIVSGRALGFTGEEFAQLAVMGGYAGKSLNDMLNDVNRQVVQVSDSLGVNAAIMGDHLQVMLKAPGIYGTNIKQMMATSVAAQKLGVEIETLGKMTSVFDDFESGAEAAGELAAMFGVTVDAMQMMNAEPAEQALMLKDALDASGRSFEDMSRQEKARLADLTGMDVTELQALMDPSNAFDGDALDAAGNQVDAATAATMAQEDATRELTNSMARLHEAMQPISGEGGLLGAFTDGVAQGVGQSEHFRRAISNVARSFQTIYQSGVRIGMMLGELLGPDGPFHIFSDIFDTFFDPASFSTKMANIEGFFREFVDYVMGGGDDIGGAFRRLFTQIGEELFGSTDGVGIGNMILEGLHDAFDFVAAGMIGLIPILLNGLTNLFQFLIDAMNGELSNPGYGQGFAEDGLFPMIRNALNDPALGDAFDAFGPVFMEFLSTFWDKWGSDIASAIADGLAYVIGLAFMKLLPIIIGLQIAKGALSGIGSWLASKIGMSSAAGNSQNIPERGFGQRLVDFGEKLNEFINTFEDTSNTAIMKAIGVVAAMGLLIGGALLGMIYVAKELAASGISAAEFLVVVAGVYGVAKAGEAIGHLLETLETTKISPASMGKAALILAALIAVFWAIAEVVTNVVQALSTTDPPHPDAISAFEDITMTTLMATAGIAGLAFGLGILVILASGPQLVLLLAILAATALVFSAVAGMIGNLVIDFGSMSMAKAETAAVAASAAGEITATIMSVIKFIRDNMFMGFDAGKINDGMTSLTDVLNTIADVFMPAVQRAADAITGDPEDIKAKMQIMVMIFEAFEPLAAMYQAALSVSNMDGATPDDVVRTINQLSDGIQRIISSTKTFVMGMLDEVAGLSDQQISAAEGVGAMFGGVAALLSAMAGPMSSFQDTVLNTSGSASYMWGMASASMEGQAGLEGSQATDKMRQFTESMGSFLETLSGSLQPLVNAMLNIDFGDGMTPEEILNKSCVIKNIFEALGALAGVFDTLRHINPARTDERFLQFVALLIPGGSARNTNSIFSQVELVANAMLQFRTSTGSAEAISAGINAFNVALNHSVQFIKEVYRHNLGAVDYAARIGPALDQIKTTSDVLRAKRVTPNHFDPFATTIQAFSSLSENLSDVSTRGLSRLNTAMSRIAALNPELAAQMRDGAIQPLIDMIHAYNDLGTELGSAANIVNVESLIRRVGDALQLEDQGSITVERGNVHVTVNLNVTMKADDLSHVLVENELVQAGEDYEPPVIQPTRRR